MMALPVVDEEGRLLGVITHDDALEILEEESTEDMEKISGIGGDRGDYAYLQTTVFSHFKRRFGWVLVLAFLALTSGLVLHSYEEVLTKYYILALYFPMVVAAGGNTGAQSATMVIRAMSLGELDSREFGRVIWKESRIGILLGILLGLCVAVQINFLMPGGFAEEEVSMSRVGFVVAAALMIQIFSSTVCGASLPILARILRLDPAVVASPAITTIVDVSGAIIYFTIAQALFF
jgi:magnesium transporter